MQSKTTEALADINARLGEAAREDGRSPNDVKLIAVSKTFDAPDILPVLDVGQRLFGENRVQEAKSKWPELKERYPDIELHLIGPLQSNKAKEAVELFDAIHSIDRPKIAKVIAEEMTKQGKTLQLFVQVNTGEEPQKAGVMPRETKAFVDMCRAELGLTLAGLMCIPPVDDEPAVHFAFLDKLAKECGLAGRSMGMSSDYETAVKFGATHVRVGSAIFGAR
ncbi:MAG: YggS family pyridoxal phosphate-dependent enzyme [Hyphomicrobiaceae bacterium]|nr:YggS family pyridoxal phosphate-dependent enzyme [Hyphomicrobiaceae bacterium]